MRAFLAALRELFAATINLGQAKLRGLSNPCPPHDYGPKDYLFCVKCGKYR